jgi:hypothetical protein
MCGVCPGSLLQFPRFPARQQFAIRLRGDNGASAFGSGAEPGAEQAISGEYSTSMIRMTLTAMPRRAVVGPPRQPSSPAKQRLPGYPLFAEGFGFCQAELTISACASSLGLPPPWLRRIQGSAGSLPIVEHSFDAEMAITTVGTSPRTALPRRLGVGWL